MRRLARVDITLIRPNLVCTRTSALFRLPGKHRVEAGPRNLVLTFRFGLTRTRVLRNFRSFGALATAVMDAVWTTEASVGVDT